MRLTDSNIVEYEDMFNGFDIRELPLHEIANDKDPKYLMLTIRMVKSKVTTTRLCAYIDPFEAKNTKMPQHPITAEYLAKNLIMSKREVYGHGKYKYVNFNGCANKYLHSFKDYISEGINGFNIEEWECVGGRCRIIDGKEHTKQLIRFLVVKNVERNIEDSIKNELRKTLGL